MKFSTIKKLFLTFKKYLGKKIYLVFFLSLFASFMEGFGITLLLPLIEQADSGGANYDSTISSIINAVLQFFGAAGSIGHTLLFISIVFLFKGVLKFLDGAYKGYLAAGLMRKIKAMMYDSYNKMDYRYFIKNNTGHFINVINGQTVGMIGSFNQYLTFLTQIIMALSYLLIAFLITWHFALMAVGIGVILLLLFKTLNNYVTVLSRQMAREGSILNKFLVQTLQSFKYIASTGQNKHLRTGVINSVNKIAGLTYKQTLARSLTTAMQEPVSVIFMIVIVAIQLLILGAAIGPILVALMLFYRGLRAVIGIQSSWQATMNSMGSIEMVENELEETSKNREPDGKITIGSFGQEISLKNITFSYESREEPVIRNISITIPANKTVAFAGESGAGKTTMVDILTLMLEPEQGEVLIDGVKAKEINKLSWRNQIGYVSQETVVFDDTIANNICLWKGDYTKDPDVKKRVEEAARKAYADIFINELPERFNTIVGDRGVRLSGGQRQRLFIARELYKNPKLLILDEATSALDTESEKYIQNSIDKLSGEITVIIIAHRLSTIRNADYIYLIGNGSIIESGTYEVLTSMKEGRFYEMINIQKI